MPNDLRFIQENIYALKREYGDRIKLGKVISTTNNVKTGKKTNQISEISISRAIQLPNQISLEFIRSIGGQRGLEAITNSIVYLIDKKDISAPFLATFDNVNSYVIDSRNQKLDVLKIDDFPYSLIVRVKAIASQQSPSNDFSNQLAVTSGVVNS